MSPIVVKGKNVEVSEPLRQYAEAKVAKLERHLEPPVETTVEVSQETARNKDIRYVVQVTTVLEGAILRGEEKASEVHAAVDAVVDVMDRQIERYKGKRFFNRRKAGQTRIAQVVGQDEEAEMAAAEGEMEEVFTGKVVRHKRFPMKPMFEEEATEQMELLGHNFFFFLNAATGQYNVLYRRQDGDYGLIEPEIA